MPVDKLYIIGNGFDLQHGIKSRYRDFKKYLEDKDDDLVEKLEKYLGSDVLWSDFEETLAHLDTRKIIDECSNYLESYGAENWSDAYHHDYQYEVQKRIDLITKILKERFTEWILQLHPPDNVEQSMVNIDRKAVFINFNYTNTLERLYKVPTDRILYIHNKAIDSKSTLILGHSRNPKNGKTLDELYNDQYTDVRVAEGNRILDAYFVNTYKSTEKIINLNKIFFNRLSKVETIYVFGHSLSVVDKPYYQGIVKRINKEKVIWKVSFHSKKDLINFKQFFMNLKIPNHNVTYDRISNIDSPQLTIFTKD